MKLSQTARLSIVLGVVYFFSTNGFAALPNLSIQFLLKEKLGLGAAEAAYFHSVLIIAWVLKPVWGFISDRFPIFGFHRKSYLVIMSLIAAIAWFALGTTQHYTVRTLLTLMTVTYAAYAFQDVVADGLMVQSGKPKGKTGLLQSVQWSAVYSAMLLTSLFGGYVSDLARKGTISYQHIFLLTMFFPVLTMFVVMWFTDEPKLKEIKAQKNRSNVFSTFRDRNMWLVGLFLFLWNFSPSLGTPFFYYTVDTLHFDGAFIGILRAVASGSAFVGALLFGKYFSRLPVRKLLIASVAIGVVVTLFHYIYFLPALITHPERARYFALISGIPFGIVSSVVMLLLLDLAAKSTPENTGGTVFALLSSCFNLGTVGSDILGGFLYAQIGLKPLIAVSAAFSLLALFVMPYLAINEPLTRMEKKIKNCINWCSFRKAGKA